MPVPAERGIHQRRLLRDEVYGVLRDAIVQGRFTPGEQLRDAELSAWLGVSRTPIREALLRLERSGLVRATPGRSTVVAPEDAASVRDAQQVAAELHALAVRLATGRIDAAGLTAMREANRALRQALSAGDVPGALAADDAFHRLPVDACGNRLVANQLEEVTATLRRSEYLHFGSLTGADSPDQHDAIVAAMESGDGERAADLTRRNWLRLAT